MLITIPVTVALGLIVIYCFYGCAVEQGRVYIKNGKSYGVTGELFKAQWDDFYKRGLSYSSGGYWSDAAADFSAAIQKRSLDQRRSRTYGMHLIDYFPNRELGVAFFHLGRYPESIDVLEKALSMVETARVKLFLNKARKAWIISNQRDVQAPEIRIAYPPPGFRTADFELPVRAIAKDNFFIAAVTLNGKEQQLELTQKYYDIRETIGLQEGVNLITLQAEDILGKSSDTVSISVTVDRQGPLMFLSKKTTDKSRDTFLLAVYDDSGIENISVNGTSRLNAGSAKYHVFEIHEHDQFNGTIEISSVDCLGNETRMSVAVDTIFKMNKNGIHLYGLSESAITFKKSIKLAGYINCRGQISNLVINEISLLPQLTSTESVDFMKHVASSSAGLFAFSKNIKLFHVSNDINVAAHVAGDTINRAVNVVRKIPSVRQLESRLSMAVMPFEDTLLENEDLSGTYVKTVVETALRTKKRFKLVEIDKEMYDQKHFDNTGLKHVTESLPADTVLYGSVTQQGSVFQIEAYLYDSEAGAVIAEHDICWEGSSAVLKRLNIDRLAEKFVEQFPLCEGRVTESAQNYAAVSVKMQDNVFKGMRFLTYSESEFSTDGYAVDLGSETIKVAEIKLERIFKTHSLAHSCNNQTLANVRQGQKIIAK